MVKEVELPTGEIGEYPDSMSWDEVSSALRKQFPPTEQQEEPKNKNPFMIKNPEVQQQARETMDTLSKPKTYGDLAKGLMQGTLNLPSDTINLPIKLGNYLNKTNAPELPRFDFAPKTGASEIGELVSGLIPVGAGLPKTANIIGKQASKVFSPIAEDISSSVGGKYDALKKFLGHLNPKNLAYRVQKEHDKLFSQSKDLYNFVKDEAIQRGVNKIDINKDLIIEAEKYLPKTTASKKLIEKARTGDYEALHKLQSDLGKKGSKGLASDLMSENDIGHEVLDLRNKINDSIINHFKEYGHDDLAKLLQEATSKFKLMKETYYKHPTISKLVNEDYRIVPKNPLTALTEESKRISPLFEADPELKKAVDFTQTLNKTKKVGKYGLVGIGLEELLRRNLFK